MGNLEVDCAKNLNTRYFRETTGKLTCIKEITFHGLLNTIKQSGSFSSIPSTNKNKDDLHEQAQQAAIKQARSSIQHHVIKYWHGKNVMLVDMYLFLKLAKTES